MDSNRWYAFSTDFNLFVKARSVAFLFQLIGQRHGADFRVWHHWQCPSTGVEGPHRLFGVIRSKPL